MPQTFMNEFRPQRRRGDALLQARPRRGRRHARRTRPRARQSAGQGRRRQRRPQRPALDHRPYRQRLQARPARHRPSRRQGAGLPFVLGDFSKAEMGWVEALCDAVARVRRAAREAARTRASRTRCIWRWKRRASATGRTRRRTERSPGKDSVLVLMSATGWGDIRRNISRRLLWRVPSIGKR